MKRITTEKYAEKSAQIAKEEHGEEPDERTGCGAAILIYATVLAIAVFLIALVFMAVRGN